MANRCGRMGGRWPPGASWRLDEVCMAAVCVSVDRREKKRDEEREKKI